YQPLSTMKLKICGLKHPANVHQLLILEPDYIGFIFYKKSPRFVGEVADLGWVRELPGPTKKVGVFVNEEMEVMKNTAESLGLQVVQLHGDESPEVCNALKMSGLEVWKAFGVDEDFDFGKTAAYADCCDKFLFDTKGKDRGGNGVTFDWGLMEKYQGETPFILSGGIGPQMAGQLSESFKLSESCPAICAALDINSRFETEPGLKDFELIKTFKHELFG
ncbi:MAG: phosphoribosylanthranilate isomerase, partial [Saprospiraceae bacterium]|nr:phosphoribosylanthranilate isomerase [Saprospiraceae bacterium]